MFRLAYAEYRSAKTRLGACRVYLLRVRSGSRRGFDSKVVRYFCESRFLKRTLRTSSATARLLRSATACRSVRYASYLIVCEPPFSDYLATGSFWFQLVVIRRVRFL